MAATVKPCVSSGTFVDAVVADGEIGELQVSVATHLVDVEKVEQAHLAKGKFETTARDGRLQVERVGVLIDAVRG